MASIRSKLLLSAVLPIGLCLAQVGPTGGGGAGTVGPRGATGPAGPAPAGTGAVVVNNGVASAVAVSGDGTLNPATGALTVTKSNGSTFAAVATSGSAGDLSSGTLPHARLPVLLSGDIPANAANTTGNAATATALASAPTLCPAGSYTLGIGVTGNAQNCTALPTFPSGAIVGTSDTQTLTNKTVDGVSPATMAFLDATSSVQTQLNGKAGNPGTCAIVATGGTLTLTEASCTNGGTGGTATATGSAPFTNFEVNGGNQAAITVSISGWTARNHSLRVTQGGSTVTAWTWPGTFSPAPSVYPAVGQSVAATGFYDGTTYFVFLGPNTSGVGFGAEVAAPTCSSGVLPPAGYYLAWADSTDHTIHYYSSTCAKSSYVNVLSGAANTFVTGLGANGALTTQSISATAPIALSGAGAISLSGVTSEQGNGAKVQLSTGTTTTNDCVKFDANGNTVDAGAACGSGGGGGTPGSTYFTYVNAAGTGPNNTATETSLIGSPTTGSKTIPANTFTAGAVTRFDIEGDLTTPASPDNLTLNMYMGATNVGSATITGSNIPGLTASHYKMTMTLGMSAGGASCAMLIDDVVLVAGAAAAKGAVNFQSSGTTFDCTAAQAFDFKAQWAGAQAGESIVGTVVALYTPGAPVISFNSRTGAIAPTTGDYTCAQVTNCIVSVPTQFAAANNAVTFPALPNAYKADVNSPYVQNAGIRRTSSLFANPNGNTATVGMSNTNTGSTVWVAPGASSPGMVQIPVANNSPVGIVETSVAHRTGRTNGMTLECMGANTVITAIRAIPCGLTSTTLANSLGADVPGSFSMAYIVFSTTGVYTSGTDTTHYMLCTVNGTTQNCVSTGVAFDANVHRFRLFEDIANSRWTGCVDGTCVNNATDNPASGTNLAFVGGAFGIAAASGNWQLAYAQTTEDYK